MIKRTIIFCIIILLTISTVTACSFSEDSGSDSGENIKAPVLSGLKYDHSMSIQYAKNFKVDYYHGGYVLISVSNGDRFLLVPEGMDIPRDLEEDISVLEKPISNVYLVASAAMAFFNSLDSLDSIRLSGININGWFIEEAKKEMEAGNILFAGKYSAPDYELIAAEKCKISIQSDMITHTPDIQEKLEELGLTVIVDQSSYESHPLGRTEWIKFYSALLGKEELGEELFNIQAEVFEELSDIDGTGKTVSFFYITSAGTVAARNTNDYFAKMIELAGGDYIFDDLGDPLKASSATQMDMETFYAAAKDAEIIIYNSTIAGSINSIEDILAQSELLSDFKAVKDGNVWCTNQNLYQGADQLGTILRELNILMNAEDENEIELSYFYKLH